MHCASINHLNRLRSSFPKNIFPDLSLLFMGCHSGNLGFHNMMRFATYLGKLSDH